MNDIANDRSEDILKRVEELLIAQEKRTRNPEDLDNERAYYAERTRRLDDLREKTGTSRRERRKYSSSISNDFDAFVHNLCKRIVGGSYDDIDVYVVNMLTHAKNVYIAKTEKTEKESREIIELQAQIILESLRKLFKFDRNLINRLGKVLLDDSEQRPIVDWLVEPEKFVHHYEERRVPMDGKTQDLTARGTPRKRNYRKSEDVGGDPAKEQFREHVKLGARVPRELQQEFAARVKAAGIPQGKALSQAIEKYIESLPDEPS